MAENSNTAAVLETAAAPVATEQTAPVRTAADQANADYAKEVIAAGLKLRHGFEKTKKRLKENERSYDMEILLRAIIQNFAAAEQRNIDWDNIDRNTYTQGKELINAVTDPEKFNARCDELSKLLKEAGANLRKTATNRVSFKGGIPALAFAMQYVNYVGTREDVRQTMLNAPVMGS
jgi:hypothetical protein